VADVANLNRARKAKRRQTEAKVAAENRVAFGRTRAQKGADRAAEAARRRALEQARREP